MHGKDFVQGGTYESVTMENVFKVVMRLVVRPMDSTDLGAYKCVAKNSVGETERTLYIHRKILNNGFDLVNVM